MSSSNWMEIETLSRDIADSNSSLEGAKLVGSDGLAQVIQKEIGQLERRRSDLLANIANVVGGPADAGQQVPPAGNPASEEAAAAIEQETKPVPNTNDIAEDSEALNMESNRILPEHDAGDETAEEIEAAKDPDGAELRAPGVVTPLSLAMTAQSKPVRHERMPAPAKMSGAGLGSAWNRLTPADLDRAKQDLEHLWVDTLARHAQELKALAADQADIDNLERAIEVFTRRFPQPTGISLAAQNG